MLHYDDTALRQRLSASHALDHPAAVLGCNTITCNLQCIVYNMGGAAAVRVCVARLPQRPAGQRVLLRPGYGVGAAHCWAPPPTTRTVTAPSASLGNGITIRQPAALLHDHVEPSHCHRLRLAPRARSMSTTGAAGPHLVVGTYSIDTSYANGHAPTAYLLRLDTRTGALQKVSGATESRIGVNPAYAAHCAAKQTVYKRGG